MLDNYDHALDDLEKAIELDVEFALAYSLQGYVYAILGNYQQAMLALDKAIELDSELAAAYYFRGIVHYELEHDEQAIQDLETFLELDPNAPERHEVEATLAELQWQPLQAVDQRMIDVAELRERPILHWELTETEGEERISLAATLPDGRKVGTYPYQGAVWSPTGELFALMVSDDVQEAVVVMNLEGEAQAIFTPDDGEGLMVWQLAWSPDGQRLALIVVQEAEEGLAFTLVVVDVAARQTLSRHPIPDGTLLIPYSMQPFNKFRWSPDGRNILISWENAVVFDLENERTLSIAEQPVVAEWTPEGDGVYYLTIENYDQPGDRPFGGFFLRKLDADKPVQLLDAGSLAASGVKIHGSFHYALMLLSPSASKLAIVGGGEEGRIASLLIYDLKQGEVVALDQPAHTFQIDTSIAALEWSPDELSVAVVALEQDGALTIKRLDVVTAEWQELARLQLNWSDGGLEWLGLLKIISWTH